MVQRKTKAVFNVLGLLGYPLGHSLSPVMHEAALKKNGLQGTYIPVEIEPKRFREFMKAFRLLPFTGVNVTVPYKEKVMPFLDELSRDAKAIGAVNTIVRKGKKLVGHNTDVHGFLFSLKKDLRFEPKGKTIFLLGAGGAARAVVYGLAKEKASVIFIADRMYAKAKKLGDDFALLFPKTTIVVIKENEDSYKKILAECDLLINATPCGLKKKDPSVVPAKLLPKKKLYVYDLIYNPANTGLTKLATRRQWPCANGVGMLAYQGAVAFSLWTGKKEPLLVMRKALEAALKKKK